MDRIAIWVLFVSLFLLLHAAISESDDVKRSLIKFLGQLYRGNGEIDPSWGWNMSSDPCKDQWKGVFCNTQLTKVKRIVLDGLDLVGTIDGGSVCTMQSLSVLSLNNNSVNGEIPEEIGNCTQLTHLYISGNRFMGNLPDSLSQLNNLKRLHISNNNFSGRLPDLPRISGLISFIAENNQLSGEIPKFDFSNLQMFNVSFNNFSGPIPDLKGRFNLSSLMGNPELCGKPLSNECPPQSPPLRKKSKHLSIKHVLMYSGYIIIGLGFVSFVAFKLINKNKNKEEKKVDVVKKGAGLDDTSNKTSRGPSSDNKSGVSRSRSEYSITSTESAMMASPLVVLTSPVVKELRFEDLLRAPAELLGRGRHGSLYKVTLDVGTTLAVKRIKDWDISSENFNMRMKKMDQVKHPNVLPIVAFYVSKQEKLLVYEYQKNGSLFKLLHGTQSEQIFDWGGRLSVAASISGALAFMHKEFHEDEIIHGNIKSSNILLSKDMEPCISEYGLIVVDNQDNSLSHGSGRRNMEDPFKVDVYGFGVILLELLTGKLVQNNGFELASWVHSMVNEEWTGEVFDTTLITDGASEERMVNLLQVALKCINPSLEARPSMNQVAFMINAIREEEERSIVSEP